MDAETRKEGVLLKNEKSTFIDRWKPKWFMVDMSVQMLTYYPNQDPPVLGSKASKALPLATCSMRVGAHKEQRCLMIREASSGYTMTLRAETAAEQALWEAFLTKACGPPLEQMNHRPPRRPSLTNRIDTARSSNNVRPTKKGSQQVEEGVSFMPRVSAFLPSDGGVAALREEEPKEERRRAGSENVRGTRSRADSAPHQRLSPPRSNLNTQQQQQQPPPKKAAPLVRSTSLNVRREPVDPKLAAFVSDFEGTLTGAPPAPPIDQAAALATALRRPKGSSTTFEKKKKEGANYRFRQAGDQETKAPPAPPSPPPAPPPLARQRSGPIFNAVPKRKVDARRPLMGGDNAALELSQLKLRSAPGSSNKEAFTQSSALQAVFANMQTADEEVGTNSAKACGAFRLNVRAVAFGVCFCGWQKCKHGAQALEVPVVEDGKGRVRALLEQFESAMRAAREQGLDSERILSERDPRKIAELLARNRKRALKIEEQAKVEKKLPACSFANISSDRHHLAIEIRVLCLDFGIRIRYKVELCGDENNDDWVVTEPTAVDSYATKLRLHAIEAPGRYCFSAMALPADAEGKADSFVASAYFTLEVPRFLQHESHVHELESVTARDLNNSASLRCGVCSQEVLAIAVARQRRNYSESCVAYGCAEGCSFLLCLDCALEEDDPGHRRKASVAIDVGAKRLWLSHPVQFVGNQAVIGRESQALLEQLGHALKRHPGICATLEGHTNSRCDATCDGAYLCENTTCAANFHDQGGAMGFSKRRAQAVERRLTKLGVHTARLDSRGLAGSRRIVDDTESKNNFRNRRVEVHCSTELL